MSVPTTFRKPSDSRDIPTAARRILINDASQLPADYSSTPGGTIFSTTPGGTKIIYDRSFLLQMRNSPLSKTPPANLPNIPGVTTPSPKKNQKPKPQAQPQQNDSNNTTNGSEKKENDEPQFEMDI